MIGFDDDFWPIARRWRGRYSNPRRGRGGAEPAWDKVVKEGADPAQICLGAKGYVAHIKEDSVEPQHVLQARTFLNGWHWEQYVELAIETEKREAEDLLEQRRNYWRYGQRDALRGDEPGVLADCFAPEIQVAYDQGYANGKGELVRPGLRVVG